MAWVKLEDTFAANPKFFRLARRLGIRPAEARGLCATLWSWAIQHAADGNLSGCDPEDIERICGWEGEPGACVEAMLGVNVLDSVVDEHAMETVLVIHDWMQRAGSFLEARRQARKREKDKSRHVTVTLPSRDSHVTRHADVTPQRESRERVDHIYIREEDTLRHEDLVEPKNTWSDRVYEVYVHYRTYHPRSAERLSPTSKVYKLIVQRLKDGFSVDDLKLAIDGCHASPWHGGKNDQHKKYQSLDLIVRDVGKVQNFIELAEQHCKDKADPGLEKRAVFLTKLGVRLGLGEPTPNEISKAREIFGDALEGESAEASLCEAIQNWATTWSEALEQIKWPKNPK